MLLNIKDKIIVLFLFFSLIFIGLQKINLFQDYNPTVIVENHKFNNDQNIELHKGDKVTERFISKNNNLGTVSIKYNTYNRINDDYLQFRIKENGSNYWYYSNKYKTDQFINGQYFSFGFPLINDSKGKIYQIEITSLAGVKGNYVQMVVENSPYLSRYSFPKSYLYQNKREISVLVLGKMLSYFNHVGSNIILFALLISLLSSYLLNFVNTRKLMAYLNKSNMKLFFEEKSLFTKIKKNKFFNSLPIIISGLLLFVINLLVNDPIKLKTLSFSDDLISWSFFDVNRNNFFGYVLSSAANKFRPVFHSVFFILFYLFGSNTWLFGIFNLMFNFFIVVILFMILRKISNDIFIPIFLSIAFILSRFAYYNITQALGIMEAMALLFAIVLLYLLWRYLNTEKIKYFWISIVIFLTLLLTHERFITLVFLYLVMLISLKINIRNIKLFFISILPIIFVWGIKIFILRIRPFDGTGGTDILTTFSLSSFFEFFMSGWLYIFGINAGPGYLNGIPREAVPQNINSLIIISELCLFLVFIIFGLVLFKNKKKLITNYIRNFILFVSFIVLTIISASVTFRLEMRWLYVPFVGLLFLVAYMVSIIKNRKFLGKISLILIFIWLCLIVPVDIFYRSNFKNLYFWGSQTFRNELYNATFKKFGNNFLEYEIYIVCAKETSLSMLSCKDHGDLNLFFSQFKNKKKISIYLTDRISQINPIIEGKKMIILIYDQKLGIFIDINIGNELRKAVLKSGWYGWNDGNISIWAGKEAEALFRTGNNGIMTFEGFLPEYNLPNTITFFVDNESVSTFYIEKNPIEYVIKTPKNKIIDLKIVTGNTISPAKLNVGTDIRQLGVLIKDIKMK